VSIRSTIFHGQESVMTDHAELWNLAETEKKDLIGFAQQLVRTPSMPGEEAEMAVLLQRKMEQLGYDDVWRDKVGNVIGRIGGDSGPSLMLNGHMDHVDVGDEALWPHPPFGGEIHQGKIWGRASVDMKGALAAMIYAGALAKRSGRRLPGDVFVSGVVQEEVGGLGSRYLAKTLPVDRVIVGEASQNELRRGQRGRVELNVRLEGRSVHASMPDLGVNPHFSMARFLGNLPLMEMESDPDYGRSSVAPTRIHSEPGSANVTPSSLHLVLDWRNIPGEQPEQVAVKLKAALDEDLQPGCEGQVAVAMKELVSYTGFQMTYPDTFPSFTTAADDPWVVRTRSVLEAVWGREVEVGTWRFATDGGHFALEGAAVLGFGPGDDAVVHTVDECLPVEQLVEGAAGYLALCLA
jgi:putative selenium metabolism hydrolase